MASPDNHSASAGLRRWRLRAGRERAVLGVTALVFVILVFVAKLPWALGLAGFVLIALTALWAGRSGGPAVPPAPEGARDAGPGAAARNALLDTILSGLPDPVVALDRDGNVLARNAGASMVAPALRPGEPASLALRMPEVVDAIRRATATGKSERVEFSERVPVDRWYEAFVTSLPTGQGGARGTIILLTLHDLTPLRRVEEMRADFVANASHELRTPLAALLGFIETLQGPARDDPAARERFLDIMRGQATRMARLIDDLLSLSRIELNAHLRPDKPVDLIAIVRQVADGLQTLAGDRGVEIRINIDVPEGPLRVLGDRDELVRIFENLVENALKYAASGKRVDIDLSCVAAAGNSQEALVTVRDYGPGIPPEHLPRLTERFYRVDVKESRAQGGTGLGLALVKHILNRHGGRLTVTSNVGKGAAFNVYLPLA